MHSRVKEFFFPTLNRRFLIRLALVAATAYTVFRFLLIPAWSNGASMEPNYRDGGFNFCFTLRFLFHPPRPGDVVMVRLGSGTRVMLLKRVVAVGGETVEFRDGRLFVNGEPRPEPYVQYPCHWNMAPVEVKPGHVFVVGDNRRMRMRDHIFGQAPLDRIVGGPLW